MGDVLNIEIPLHWKPVPVDGGHFSWHRNPPKNVRARDTISGPKVYRWVLRKVTGEIASVYIGQSEKFQRRVSAYRKGKQTPLEPDGAVQSAFKEWAENGGTVELQFLDLEIEPFCINGERVTIPALAYQDTRLMMESIAIFSSRASGLKVLNRLQENVHVKELRRLLPHIVKDSRKIEQILSMVQSMLRPRPPGS